ncbi:MAG: hypothetical protein JST70_18615 [Bacteroidetes bacterium]|nr:hypothetical protein [Bacteroidota bacterium]
MLHLVRNNSPYTVIILFIFTLVAKLQALSAPVAPLVPANHEFFHAVVSMLDVVLRGSAFGYTLLGAIMLFGQAIYLNSVCIRYKLLSKPTYLIAYMYIVLTSVLPAFTYFGEVMLVNWCMIGCLDFVLRLPHTSQPRIHIFNGAFLASMAAVLHFQAVAFIILLFAAIAFLRPFNIGEWMVAIVGYITPLYLYAGILFLFDKEKALLHWPEYGWSLPGHLNAPLYLIGTLIGILTLTISGIFVLQSFVSKGSIYTRRIWSSIAVFLFMAVAVSLITDISEKNAWLMVMIPLSIIIAPALSVEKTKSFSNFAFYFSLVLLIFCQLTFK